MKGSTVQKLTKDEAILLTKFVAPFWIGCAIIGGVKGYLRDKRAQKSK